MEQKNIAKIAGELNISVKQVTAVAALLAENATVPFIARYRKEATNSLDEVAITAIRDRLQQLADLDKRRIAILESLQDQGNLTDDLKSKVLSAETMTTLEDIYLPYRPKRRTRATIAKEKGLEPLAKWLFDQQPGDISEQAKKYIDPEKEVDTPETALAGARDIIAEWISEDQQGRTKIRSLYQQQGLYTCKVIAGKEEEAIKYKDYYDWSEPVSTAASHRVLAMRRGSKEKFLILRITVAEEKALAILNRLFVKNDTPAAQQVTLAAADSFKRLMAPSIETDIRLESKKKADQQAVKVFAENARQLLLSSPLGEKSVMAIDPGFRTGCKVVCLDRQGKLLYNDAIYPLMSDSGAQREGQKVIQLCEKFKIEAIAIGNGTAGRETEAFIRDLDLPKTIHIMMVNESGASVYSASQVAREEFPDFDLTVRGAVSIGRRLMDPLAELVKIDPKSIGVGQYQHDVDQTLLKLSLDDTVMSCVNAVGVEVNTASKQLLTYVSGVGPTMAEKIVQHRNEKGPFAGRDELKKIPGLGDKTFEQCAGFLRIRGAKNPLDSSSVHPESYQIVNNMAEDLGCSVDELISNSDLVEKIEPEKYMSDKVGLPTLIDIVAELKKPGRDPRKKFEPFSFTEGVNEITDLKVGMELAGIVTNVTAFGAFVDIGVHQDALVHISEMADRFIKDPADIVKVQQEVKVRVLEIDIPRKRISLTMKSETEKSEKKPTKKRPETKKPKTPPAKQNTNKPFGNSLGINLSFGKN